MDDRSKACDVPEASFKENWHWLGTQLALTATTAAQAATTATTMAEVRMLERKRRGKDKEQGSPRSQLDQRQTRGGQPCGTEAIDCVNLT